MTRWCIWCEKGKTQRGEYYWIHKHCYEEMRDFASLGEDLFKKYQEAGHLSKEDAEKLMQSLAEFQKGWAVIDRRLEKLRGLGE